MFSFEGEDIPIVGVERTIDFISDVPVTWQIYFSQDG